MNLVLGSVFTMLNPNPPCRGISILDRKSSSLLSGLNNNSNIININNKKYVACGCIAPPSNFKSDGFSATKFNVSFQFSSSSPFLFTLKT